MPYVFFGAAAGFLIGLCLMPPSNHDINQWVDECRSKGGAAVYVYTANYFAKRINCLDAKRVDMKDNEP